MKKLGPGIAIAGIWIGIGLSCLSPVAAAKVDTTSIFATLATIVIAFSF